MAKEKMGEVTTSNGGVFYYYWDNADGKVYVGNEFAGTASSADKVWQVANYYAGTNGTKRLN